MLAGRDERLPLGPAADGAGDVQARGRRGPAREDEALQLRQVVVERVAERLQPVDQRLLDAQPALDRERHAEVGADVEELVLDPAERLAQLQRALAREDDAEERVELVDRAVRGDPGVELRDAGAVAERGLARVAAAGVDARQSDRLVGGAGHGGQPTRPAATIPTPVQPRARRGCRGRSRAAGSRSCPRRSP